MIVILMLGLGMVVAWVLGHNAMRIGIRLGLLDFPDMAGGRKLHAGITPLIGGLAVVAASLLAIGVMLAAGIGDRTSLIWLAITVAGMFLIGVTDDRFELRASIRLLLAVLLLLATMMRAPDFQLSFLLFSDQDQLTALPGLLGMGFTLLCLVGFLNAVNMADGKNGIVIGQALIWSLVLAFRVPESTLPLLAALAGSLLVLFLFNMAGKLFLGDGGSYSLSAVFGLIAIHAWNHGFADMRVDDVALVFALPVLDTLRLMAQRTLQGKSPFTPGRDHLHHYLYARWGWPRPLLWLLALVAIPNIGALLFPGTALWWLLVTLLGYLALLAAALSHHFAQWAR